MSMNTSKKNSLGKGLSSLLKNSTPPAVKASQKKESKKEIFSNGVELVSFKQIVENPHQPRKLFKEEDLQELSSSIKENGILQPLVVSRVEKGYELIAGERRLRAAKLAGLDKVPVIVKESVTEREKFVWAIIENVQRSDLNCVEEALAYYNLMNEFKLSQEEVARRVGKERSSIANFVRLLKLPRKVLQFLQEEKISLGHGKILVGLKDPLLCEHLALLAAEEGLSVRELEERVKQEGLQEEKGNKKNSVAKSKAEENLNHLALQLEQKLGKKIEIKTDAQYKGRITLHFNGLTEFNELYRLME